MTVDSIAPDRILHCSLRVAPLGLTVRYMALSYTCGYAVDEAEEFVVVVNGVPSIVRPSPYIVLAQVAASNLLGISILIEGC